MERVPATMQAVCLRAVPDGMPQPSDFVLQTLPVPRPGAGQVLVRLHWLSLDPFLRAQLGGRYVAPCPPLGAVLPGYAVGTVVEDASGRHAPGQWVTGLLGWAQYAVADASALTAVDPALGPPSTAVGVLGIPGLTAWAGVRRILEPRPGQTIVISTAAGAVGSVAGQLCRIAGARVVGLTSTAEKCALVTGTYGFDACINYRAPGFTGALRAACPERIDGYFDNAGGAVLETVLGQLAPRARVVLCGLSDQYNRAERPPGPNLGPVIAARARLEGLVVYDHLADLDTCRRELAGLVAAGRLRYREHVHHGLENAVDGFIGLLRGENTGKALVAVAHE